MTLIASPTGMVEGPDDDGRLVRLRPVPRPVWAITALFGLLLVGWSLLAPLHHAPDETVHGDLVLQQARGEAYPDYDGRKTSIGVFAMASDYLQGVGAPPLTEERAEGRVTRTLFQWGGSEPGLYDNQMPQHPPLYYTALGTALRVERWVVPGVDEASLSRQWHLMRLHNVLLILPLPLLAWAAARRLGAGERVAITAAVVPLCVPQLLHIGSAINNDNLLIVLSAGICVLVAGVLRGDDRITTALAIGGLAGLALLTKAFAFALLPWIAIAYGYAAMRARPRRIALVRNAGVAIVVPLLIGGWWWVRNQLRFGDLSPSVLDPAFATSPAGFEPDPLWYGRHFTTTVIHRFWGNFGYWEAPMTPAIVVLASTLAAVAVGVAILGRRRSTEEGSAPPARLRLVIFGSLFAFVLVLVAARAYDLYATSGRTPFMQGRYLFTAIVPFAVLIALGAARLLGARAPLVVLGAAGVMQADAVWVATRAWWAEPDASFGRSTAAMVAWAPWRELSQYLLLAATGVTATVVVLLLLRPGRADDASPDDPPTRGSWLDPWVGARSSSG